MEFGESYEDEEYAVKPSGTYECPVNEKISIRPKYYVARKLWGDGNEVVRQCCVELNEGANAAIFAETVAAA